MLLQVSFSLPHYNFLYFFLKNQSETDNDTDSTDLMDKSDHLLLSDAINNLVSSSHYSVDETGKSRVKPEEEWKNNIHSVVSH